MYEMTYTLLIVASIILIFLVANPLLNMARSLLNKFLKLSYAVYLSLVVPFYNKAVYTRKKELFKSLGDHLNAINGDIVEIGAGTAANFEFFPDGCSVVTVDPNPYMERFFRRTKKMYPKIVLKKYIVGSAEKDLREIEDGSVSAVVITTVLCSIKSPEEVLREVIRILKPGGRLYFMEHVAGKGQFLKIQKIWNLFWPYIADGCVLTCKTEDLLRKADFKNLDCSRFDVDIWFPPIKPHIIGYAEV